MHSLSSGKAKKLVAELYTSNLSIMPHNVCRLDVNKNSHKTNVSDLLIITYSAVQNFEQRTAIRATWGNMTTFPSVQLVFLIGQATDTSVAKRVVEESNKYNDLVQTMYVDSWWNLTMKHMAMLDFVNQSCPNIALVAKTDDDIYLTMPKVLKFVASIRKEQNQIFCTILYNNPVTRDITSKYYVPRDSYDKDFYPPYCNGPFYIMTSDVIPKLFQGTLKTRYMENTDDGLVTGIVAVDQGIQRTNMVSFGDIKNPSKRSLKDRLEADYGVYHLDPPTIRQLWATQHSQ
jgi:hypothetical protein